MAGGGSLRSDPQAWAWRAQAGAVLPFGTRHSVAVNAWHDESNDWHANQVVGANVLAKTGTVTGLGAQLLLGRRLERSLLLGADARYATEAGTDSSGADLLPNWSWSVTEDPGASVAMPSVLDTVEPLEEMASACALTFP